jgi:hypothetical protein
MSFRQTGIDRVSHLDKSNTSTMSFSEATNQKSSDEHTCCVVCHNPFVEVHHIIPQAAGGSDDLRTLLRSAPTVTTCSVAIQEEGTDPRDAKPLV